MPKATEKLWIALGAEPSRSADSATSRSATAGDWGMLPPGTRRSRRSRPLFPRIERVAGVDGVQRAA